ncbi:MAG: KamA family radical SAM protein [Methanomassiliicoccales archaeon]
MNDEETISIETNQTGFEGDVRAGNRGVSPLEITHSDHLRKYDPELYQELDSSEDLETIRQNLFSLLHKREMSLFSAACDLDTLERSNALNCIGVLKNLFSQRNEVVSRHNTLSTLVDIVNKHPGKIKDKRKAVYSDFFYIDLGSLGLSDIYREAAPTFLCYEGREGANVRSDYLDTLAEKCMKRITSYRSGLDPGVISRREESRSRILDYLGADLSDWADYRWHQRNVFTDAHTIAEIVTLSNEEGAAIELANMHRLPFGITPYYLSLFDKDTSRKFDHAIRAQVIPPLSYVSGMLESKAMGPAHLDFMKEGQTSPIDLVTRRYPMIAILKPFNACPQICVYCQRNWEIGGVSDPQAMASPESISRALDWFKSHPMVSEVLVTGGDPGLMADDVLIDLLQRLSDIEHIKRIRIGTRLPVVLPMRFTDNMVASIGKFHSPPEKDLCVVTHIEHPYEVTPEAVKAVQKLRMHGIGVYNQQVFTMENSRKFETSALRLLLKQIGVDPYYTFNMKGKKETNWYRVPIARLLQERKEEARMLPGLSRTDEPVFNIPALGKNYLRSWQNHDLIAISPQGERIYEFHPWEKNICNSPTFVYTDVPILDYLIRLKERGEELDDYRSIWYYF